MRWLRSVPTGIDNLQHPAYTGANRCVPCTVVNVGLALALAVAIGWLSGGRTVEGGLVAALAFAVSIGVVYLRGYLVPGTPRLTKRYLPESILARFDKAGDVTGEPRDPESALRSIGIVEDAPAHDDLVLAPAFERAWLEAIADCTTTDAAIQRGLADLMEFDRELVDVERRGAAFVASTDGVLVAEWESRAACQADVAAAAILPRFDPRWGRRPVPERLDLLATLRLFLEACPACGGEVSLSHEVVESCCRRRDVVTTTCDACTARLLEVPVDAEALESERSKPAETA